MKISMFSLLFCAGVCGAVGACDRREPAKPAEPATVEPVTAPTPKGEAQARTEAHTKTDAQPASIGAPAPEFALQDLNGKSVRLADFKGKTVVLEWFNPECPFVKASHTNGSLKGLAEKYANDPSLVWLAINSGGEGRQGFGVEVNREGVAGFGLKHPVLLDPEGSVGKSYGATNTPHMFIVDAKGTLVYSGAIDNSPDAEGESPSGGSLVNYVSQALEELAQGKSVSVPKTKAYGCSVKYHES